MWRHLIAAIALTLSALAQVSPPATGSVEGIVLDGDGRPLAEATVFVGTLARSPRTQTDAEGRFKLNDIPAGRIGLQAFKESDGYPYNMFAFFLMPGQPLPKFDLAAGQTLSNVIIRLGAKAAYLKLSVRDENNLPIDAGLTFSRPDLGRYGDYQRSAKPDDLILVPPVPFRLTVQEKGFQPWHYGGEHWLDKEGLIVLKSGETLTLTVRLKKLGIEPQ